MTSDDLSASLLEMAANEPGPHFMGKPERWYDDPHWRCTNDHVSGRYLKTEEGSKCLAGRCDSFVYLTFPEDREGDEFDLAWFRHRLWCSIQRTMDRTFPKEEDDED